MTSRFKAILVTLLLAIAALCFPLANALAQTGDEYVFGTLVEYSTYERGKPLADGFYYSDDWFSESPAQRNDSLALVSMQLVASTFLDTADAYGAGLGELGFTEIGYVPLDTSRVGSCGFTWGKKTVEADGESFDLIAVVFQNYDPADGSEGWRQNFTINGEATSGEQYAYALAAEGVIEQIAALCGDGPAKVWLAGESRGGAVGNIVAAKLPGVLGSSCKGVFAYTFEAPATVDAAFVDAYGACEHIHNYLCDDDIVTKVPLWGMARYGNLYELKTAETDERLFDELERMGSPAKDAEVGDARDVMARVIGELEARIPTRADYSLMRVDEFVDAAGTPRTVAYGYQEMFRNLMGFIMGGELSGLSTDSVRDRVGELLPYVTALAESIEAERAGDIETSCARCWDAAVGLHAFLDELCGAPISLSDVDMYALLKLVGPSIVDTSYEPLGEVAEEDVMGYIAPLVEIALSAKSMVFSHHFDTVIARLKTLAPAPELDDIDIPIDEPAAGDSTAKAPEQVRAYIASLGDHLSAEAAWETDADSLEDDCVHYLTVTLRVSGQAVPDDFQLTVNGADPIAEPSISYEAGTDTVIATYTYTLGNPSDVTVSFDSAGHGSSPAPMTVRKGSALAYESLPEFPVTVKEDGVSWRFVGWFSEDGTPWDKVIATSNLTVHAAWKQLIDHVEVSFQIPSVGDAPAMPTVPAGMGYEIELVGVEDASTYEYVERIDHPGTYTLEVLIRVSDPEAIELAIEKDEWDCLYYMGDAQVNGEADDAVYDDAGDYLIIRWQFEVTDEAPAEVTYRVTAGDRQSWTKGSGKEASFTATRSADDSQTYGRFTELAVDGVVVDPTCYEAKPGSIIALLKPAFLETLSVGAHAIEFRFDDGTAKGTFTIVAPGTQPSNDPSNHTPASGTSAGTATRPVQTIPHTGDATCTATAWIALLGMLALAAACGSRLGRKARG